MGRPRTLGAGGIDPIAEEPHHARGSGAADGGPDQAALACAISAEASAVLAVMRRGLRHPRATAADAAAAEHPLVASLRALRRLAFSPAAASPPSALPAAALRPFLDAVRSEDAGAAVTSASLAALHEVMSLKAGAEPAVEEAVLMRMLQALLACLRRARGGRRRRRQLPLRGRGRARRRGGRAHCLRAPAAAALGDQHI